MRRRRTRMETIRVTLIFVVIAIVGIGLVVLAGTRRLGQVDDPTHDRRAAELPADNLAAADLEALQFGVGLRGYRMDEVDGVLDRLTKEIADRDQKIADLSASQKTVSEG